MEVLNVILITLIVIGLCIFFYYVPFMLWINAVVSGVVGNGVGFGQASVKKPASGPWPVVIEY